MAERAGEVNDSVIRKIERPEAGRERRSCFNPELRPFREGKMNMGGV